MPETIKPVFNSPGRALLRDFARVLLIAVILPALLLAALLLWLDDAATRAQFGSRLSAAAESTGHDVDTFVQSHLVALQVVAERRSTAGDIEDLAGWESDLQRLRHHYPAFRSLLVTDPSGWLRIVAPAMATAPLRQSVADREYFRVPLRTGRAHVSNAFRGRALGSDPLVAVSTPLLHEGRFAGVLEGSIRIDTFAALRTQWLRSRGFEALLVDGDETVIFATQGLAPKSLDSLRDVQWQVPAVRSRPEGARTRMDQVDGLLSDGGSAYALAIPLKVGWRLMVLVPERTVQAELRKNILVMLGLLAIVLLGVLVIAGVQMRRLGSSVRELLERMQRFALGRESVSMSPDSVPREVAPLAAAMNQLSTRAHKAYAEVVLSLAEQRRLHEELQTVARHLLTVQEDERRTLSRDLHDDIGQAITAIKLGALSLMDDDNPGQRAEILGEIVDITDQTVAKLRNISLLLRPPQIDALGLEAAVRWQSQLLFRSGEPVLDLALSPLPERPAAAVELACFRIIQEALTNVLRYAAATRVTVSIASNDGTLSLSVSDNGKGFTATGRSGLGLVTMRERAHLLGGWFHIESAPGEGTTIRARLPMQPVAISPE